ncbi:hypothetical protein HYPSUDRAFT_40009 [Hypholoma sublateritium FD-334 SS-4]|uniref:ABM domain-containing protein n=1 Tax=Hypholoma sublateritium (strain FD-334 SS-4) TaxID=945553 RepID=A0A0D2MHW1_HYPSF|nr:hypothetical protein HYPSUDRAFT_40009 [Hypholoma sublateritium FD-334 SS-4]
MPIHEIIMFNASEAFATDPAGTLKPAAEFFSKTGGCLGVWGGIAEEEKTGYIVIAWETFEHHQAIMDAPGYPGTTGLAPVFAGETKKVYHVELTESPDEALSMPTTEILSMSLKKNKTRADLAGALDILTARLTAEEGCSNTYAWGQTREDPNRTVYLFLGWESTKRHFAIVGQRSYSDDILNLFSQVDIKMLHIGFNKVV